MNINKVKVDLIEAIEVLSSIKSEEHNLKLDNVINMIKQSNENLSVISHRFSLIVSDIEHLNE